LPYFVRHSGFVKIFTAMGVAGALWVKGLEDGRTYEAGERLDVSGRPQVVFTPGHTHGHFSLAFPTAGR
jgi:glyoxylase-like metal-dependent hydrolase (beta-lactamase superfamily II)